MTRPLALGLSSALLFVGTASAQFARPPVVAPRPPTPIPRPVVVPVPTPIRPPTLTPTRPGSTPNQPIRLVPINPALLAVLGGTAAAKPAKPTGVAYYLPPVVDREAFAAVAGNAGTRPVVSVPVPTPPVFVNAAPVNNGPDWMLWAISGGAAAALLLSVVLAVRPRGGKVRVFDVPPGEAPDWVRQAWVGVELPTLHKQPRVMPSFEVKSGEPAGEWVGYAVDGRAAVRALAAVSPEAADWWRANLPGVMTPGYQLVFPADVCERVG